jgi:hypothetical protein
VVVYIQNKLERNDHFEHEHSREDSDDIVMEWAINEGIEDSEGSHRFSVESRMILLSHSTTPQHTQETCKTQRTKQIIQRKSVSIPFFLFQKLNKNNKFSDHKIARKNLQWKKKLAIC